jgi:hypothetical protein
MNRRELLVLSAFPGLVLETEKIEGNVYTAIYHQFYFDMLEKLSEIQPMPLGKIGLVFDGCKG